MGGDKARQQAQVQQPVVETPKPKKTRGGYYGVGDNTAVAALSSGTTSRRGSFLGAGG